LSRSGISVSQDSYASPSADLTIKSGFIKTFSNIAETVVNALKNVALPRPSLRNSKDFLM